MYRTHKTHHNIHKTTHTGTTNQHKKPHENALTCNTKIHIKKDNQKKIEKKSRNPKHKITTSQKTKQWQKIILKIKKQQTKTKSQSNFSAGEYSTILAGVLGKGHLHPRQPSVPDLSDFTHKSNYLLLLHMTESRTQHCTLCCCTHVAGKIWCFPKQFPAIKLT